MTQHADWRPYVPKKRKQPLSSTMADIMEHIKRQEEGPERSWTGRGCKLLRLPMAYFLEPQGIKDITWIGPIRWLLQYLKCPPYIPRSRWLNWLNHGATPTAYLIDEIVAYNAMHPNDALQFMNWDQIKIRARGLYYGTYATCFTLVAHNMSVIYRTEEAYRVQHKNDPDIDAVMAKRAETRLREAKTKMKTLQELEESGIGPENSVRFRIDGRVSEILNPLHPLDPRNVHNLTAFEDFKYRRGIENTPYSRVPSFGPLI